MKQFIWLEPLINSVKLSLYKTRVGVSTENNIDELISHGQPAPKGSYHALQIDAEIQAEPVNVAEVDIVIKSAPGLEALEVADFFGAKAVVMVNSNHPIWVQFLGVFNDVF